MLDHRLDLVPCTLVVQHKHGANQVRTAIAARGVAAVAESTVRDKDLLPACGAGGIGGRADGQKISRAALTVYCLLGALGRRACRAIARTRGFHGWARLRTIRTAGGRLGRWSLRRLWSLLALSVEASTDEEAYYQGSAKDHTLTFSELDLLIYDSMLQLPVCNKTLPDYLLECFEPISKAQLRLEEIVRF